jgi:hypothetical protein
VPGFPIRISADRGLVDGSPQLFAVTHVLHRFLAPRHPPLALVRLEYYLFVKEQRCSCLLCNSQCALRCVRNHKDSTQRHQRGLNELPQNEREDGCQASTRQEGPNPCDYHAFAWTAHQCTNWKCLAPNQRMLIDGGEKLLRKEVIQPHLPVRLPCYDFTPITDPTFDGSLPYGLGHRLRVLPTFVV